MSMTSFIAGRGRPVRLLLAAIALVSVAGCALFKIDEPTELYTLTPKSRFDEDVPGVFWQLVIDSPVAAANINTSRIALLHTPTSSDYYAAAGWTDRAPLMVQSLIVDSFQNTRKIVSVARDTSAVRPDYVLQTELREFQAEYFHDKGPPIVRVRIAANIVAMPDRLIIASRSIERCFRAKENKLPAIVRAYDEALGSVLKRLVAWTLRTPPRRPVSEGTLAGMGRFRDPSSLGEDNVNCPRFGQLGNVPVAD
jgi:cholesterol transport system auxiliary component